MLEMNDANTVNKYKNVTVILTYFQLCNKYDMKMYILV